MKVAIMQPYFVPYVGYFQLMEAADVFVVLDDVNFIKRGWINRNRLLCNGEPSWLTVPLLGASQNKKICEIGIAPDNGWKRKMTAFFKHNYAQAPFIDDVSSMLERWLHETSEGLSEFLVKSLKEVCQLLDIDTRIISTSSGFYSEGLQASERIISICKELGATEYINLPGGRSLYTKHEFARTQINLLFLEPAIPNLEIGGKMTGSFSILHLLVHLGQRKCQQAIITKLTQ